MSLPDIDLDVRDRENVLKLFPSGIGASILSSDKTRLAKHETGIYFQNIPRDPENGLAVFPYKMAEDLGFMKIDFLSNRVYDDITDPSYLNDLLELPTDWSWYLDERFYVEISETPTLVHLGGHMGIVKKHPPESITDLAMLIALIRPGRKHLLKLTKSEILAQIWNKPDDGSYAFKKSHSYGYGLMVSVHAKLIAMELGLI